MIAIGLALIVTGWFGFAFTESQWRFEPSTAQCVLGLLFFGGIVIVTLGLCVFAWKYLP